MYSTVLDEGIRKFIAPVLSTLNPSTRTTYL